MRTLSDQADKCPARPSHPRGRFGVPLRKGDYLKRASSVFVEGQRLASQWACEVTDPQVGTADQGRNCLMSIVMVGAERMGPDERKQRSLQFRGRTKDTRGYGVGDPDQWQKCLISRARTKTGELRSGRVKTK